MTTNTYSLIDLFDSIFEDMGRGYLTTHSPAQIYPSSFPPCDVYIKDETKDLVFEFAVAGIPKESMDLTVDGDYIHFKVEKVDREREGFKRLQKGIKSSSASQKFYVPSSKYQLGDIIVRLKDGILSVFIPAKEELKPKQLMIE